MYSYLFSLLPFRLYNLNGRQFSLVTEIDYFHSVAAKGLHVYCSLYWLK